MRSKNPATTGATLLAALALLLCLSPATVHAEFQRQLTIDGDEVVLVNLIGEIRVVGHPGSSFEIEIDVRGEDADEELIQIESDERRGRSEVIIRYPTDDERNYVYPELGRNSSTKFNMDERDGGWMSELFGNGRRIEVKGSGRGLEVWADVTIRVPDGSDLQVYLGVGQIDAREVASSLRLDTHSGPVRAQDIGGALTVDTGSGHVEAANIGGDLDIDTGSGHVQAEEVKGNARIDTGSGHVELFDVEGDIVNVDTGSGHVDLKRIVCDELSVDTGSGGVTARDLATGSASIDTGSGGIEMELVEMGHGRFELDTGSGGISLYLPEDASADIEAETGGGSIRLDVEDADIEELERDYARLRVGAGDARVVLETGSGSIRISR